MTIESATRAGRALAEQNMIDRCLIQRVAGVVTDDLTGVDTPVLEHVFAGKCRVQTYQPFEQNPEAGGNTGTVQRYFVHVPVGAFEPAIGLVVTIETASLDPHLAGRQFRVVALLHKTAATAYRLAVEAT